MTRRHDPVTPDLRERVLERDNYRCVAPRLGATDACRTVWGSLQVIPETLELDHVKLQPMMARRAPSTEATLASLCHWHHQGGWATANRPLLRSYLARFREEAA